MEKFLTGNRIGKRLNVGGRRVGTIWNRGMSALRLFLGMFPKS